MNAAAADAGAIKLQRNKNILSNWRKLKEAKN